jgi:hypothetical protein
VQKRFSTSWEAVCASPKRRSSPTQVPRQVTLARVGSFESLIRRACSPPRPTGRPGPGHPPADASGRPSPYEHAPIVDLGRQVFDQPVRAARPGPQPGLPHPASAPLHGGGRTDIGVQVGVGPRVVEVLRAHVGIGQPGVSDRAGRPCCCTGVQVHHDQPTAGPQRRGGRACPAVQVADLAQRPRGGHGQIQAAAEFTRQGQHVGLHETHLQPTGAASSRARARATGEKSLR